VILDFRPILAGLMSKRVACHALGVLLVALGIQAHAQQSIKLPRIGFLNPSSLFFMSARVAAFRQGLRELGYVEGKTIIIDYRYAEGELDRLPVFAAELVDLKVDLLVSLGAPATMAAKNVTKTIPIVMIAGDAVGTGLVRSLARPGANITGISALVHGLSGKRLELLKETVPKLSRVAVLWNPDGPGSTLGWKESETAARELGLQLHSMEVRSLNGFENAFEGATRARSAAVAQTGNPLFNGNQKRLTELAIKYRLPMIYVQREFVEFGGLMSYGFDYAVFRRVATLVDRILKGAKPGELPVEQPTKFELVINLSAAKRINIVFPSQILMWADEVLQ
jgi:putative tryptophan/tyrosine transport system substrate-binding protein